MMELPAIIKTWVDFDGVTVYTVQYKDGSTCDMTVQQYDYLKASAQAVADMDSKVSVDSQPVETPVPAEPAQNITESPDLRNGYVPEEVELPFEGSLTAYDDRAANTPALYANLPAVSNSFTAIMDWFGDTFFVERTETVHKSGYTSERYSYNSSSQLIQLPYEEDSTTTSQVLNPQACVSALLVVLVFITTVTWIKNAIWGRMS
ncbi:protein F [Uncultured phage WW-nAnB strain 3]|uniref:protein F n=1 Tax=Uncultured phage WW-nAnB strain 3 TaxID=1449897 RepID=UPI0003E3AA60|nr:protein F [Uncultured phage WW-nAnB strain 3]AHH02857.1 protein F [Uncultured phage WW-nAnB strain 3]